MSSSSLRARSASTSAIEAGPEYSILLQQYGAGQGVSDEQQWEYSDVGMTSHSSNCACADGENSDRRGFARDEDFLWQNVG